QRGAGGGAGGNRRARVGRTVRSVLERDRRLRQPAAQESRLGADRDAAQRGLHAPAMNLPIRARLTLWYVAMLALTLLLFAAGVMAFVSREQQVAVDCALRARVAEFTTAFAP